MNLANITVTEWGIFSVLFLLLFLMLNTFYRKKSYQKDLKIKELSRTLSNLEKKLDGLERRGAFRLRLSAAKPCKFEIIDVGDKSKSYEKIMHQELDGKIEDVSRTGLKLISGMDVPVRKRITIQINFNMLNEPFTLKGILVHKREEINGRIYYGVKYVDITSKEQRQLAYVLQKLEVLDKKQDQIL